MSTRYPLSLLFASLVVCPLALAADGELLRRWEFRSADDAAGWTAGNHVKDLRVADGVLRVATSGPDAYIFAPAVDVPLDGCLVRVHMASDRPGISEVFWITADAPGYSQERRVFRENPVDGAIAAQREDAPRTYEFEIGRPADRGRKLTGFRIDPFNGNAEATVRIAWVELRRLPPILDVTLTAAKHRIETGQPVSMNLRVRQVGGGASAESMRINMPGGAERPMEAKGPASSSHFDVTAERAGVNRYRATVSVGSRQNAYDLEASLIAGSAASLPVAASINSGQVRVDFIASSDGKGVAGARWAVAVKPDEWRLAGWLLPLAQVTYQADEGRTIHREPALTVTKQFSDTVRLEGFVDDDRRLRATVLLTIRSAQQPHQVAVTTSLESTGPARLLDFSGPVMLADRDEPGDPLNRHALFGGLEFLEPGWPSSSDRAVGERFAQRWSPLPFKVTLPVMAVEAGGLTTALLWTPQPSDQVTTAGPWPTFASPNLTSGQPNHLMKLSIPSLSPLRGENESYARRPVVIEGPGFSAMWQYILHAEPDLPVALTARRWYEAFKAPPPASRPHDDETTYDLIARNFGETMWWPDEKGWRHHWYHSETRSSFAPDMAVELIAHSLLTEQTQYVEQAGLREKSIIDVAGTLAARLGGEGHARAMIASMRADGTWAFQNTPQMREQTRRFTDSKYDSLGEDGSTSLGTCVQSALPILRHALISGDPSCIEAGVKALEAMRRFRVPRGAQVWEVHQEIPDIRAAALAVEAFLIGHQLTGDKRLLADANYWAWTGVPFVYSWAVPTDKLEGRMIASRDKRDPHRSPMPLAEGFQNPRRQIMPYATVPVLGPTFYVINWFGVIVQWCGLEWAQHVIELDAERPDPLLRQIADGVVTSGLQQMFDKPPWVGLYPDVWDVESNTAQGALIYAGLPLRCLVAQGRAPAWTQTWTRVLRSPDGKTRWHVSGWGTPPDLPPPGADAWSATLAFLPGQPNELLIAGAPEPANVLADEAALEHLTPGVAPGASAGWWYDPERKAILTRFPTAQSGRTVLRINWQR